MPQEKPIWRKAKLEMSAYGDAAHELDFSETLLIRYDARELERILSGWKSWVASEPMGAAIQSGEAKLESMEWAWGDEGKKPRWADLGKENPPVKIHMQRDGTFMILADVVSEAGTGEFFTDDLTIEDLEKMSSKSMAPKRAGEIAR